MKKILLFIILLLPFYIYALDYPELNSKNVIAYDLTGLVEKISEKISLMN